MARIPSKSLVLSSSAPLRRRFSSSHRRAELIEIDLDSADSGAGGVRRLEEAIHSIIARRAEPDWLRFAPGRSYWVPPRSPGIADLVGKLTNPLSPEQALSLTTPRGWPALAFFRQGGVEGKMQEFLCQSMTANKCQLRKDNQETTHNGTIPHQVEDSTEKVDENSNDEEN